ncbi:glutathione binding-like protein [Pseudomonas sp. MWU15-20650]|uniref:glutathione S-transferase family protein n=1 Tax=Pseudomonas sp. MWU15-20650 TaxID=2933107 RepID=UPI00200CABA1|nr:glutathione binding-like protein [Pseudomonas sp. MWU15-20650]
MSTALLHLFTADTPNGQKISIALEELGLNYLQINVDLANGEQKTPDFLARNPNGKIPVLVDHRHANTLFESAVILAYLAEQNGALGGEGVVDKLVIQQWLSFQIASVGPMLGQLWWFRHGTTTTNEQALDRYRRESLRLYGVVEGELSKRDYIAGDSYTIADIALFTWLRTYEELGLDIAPFPAVRAWLERLAKRPAVKRGLAKSRQEA